MSSANLDLGECHYHSNWVLQSNPCLWFRGEEIISNFKVPVEKSSRFMSAEESRIRLRCYVHAVNIETIFVPRDGPNG